MERATRTDLCIVAHGGRQQGEGVVNGDAPLYDVLAEPLQAVLAVGRGQIQQPWWCRDRKVVSAYTLLLLRPSVKVSRVRVILTNSILGRQFHVVRVKELQERPVHREGELVDFNHLLQVLIPVGLEHGSEVFASAPEQSTRFSSTTHQNYTNQQSRPRT